MWSARASPLTVALAVALVAQAVVVPVAAAGAGAGTPAGAGPTGPTADTTPPAAVSGVAFAPSNNSTTNTTTATTTPTGPQNGTPTIAGNVRITPVRMDEKFLSVKVAEPDSTFNTSGPFVFFSLSHPVEAARITQSPAEATVLAGGQQVKVTYSDDAAPPNEQSLYTLELFFADGSKKTVKLYATKTAVSVEAAQLSNYREFIETMKEDAKAHGYNATPKGVTKYHEWEKERADLVDGWLTEQAARLLAGATVLAMNPLFWVVLLSGLALFGQWLRSNFGDLLDWLQNDPGKAQRKRHQLKQAYDKQKQTADEEPLREIDAVGSSAIHWETAFGVKSVADLADVAANGIWKRTADGGEEQVHGGVDDLSVADLQTGECWLEPVLRDGRVATPERALAQLKAACRHMETEYNLGHVYRDPADRAEQLIRDLRAANRSTGTAVAGGDD